MKDYIRRLIKFIIYLILIFVLFLGILPLLTNEKLIDVTSLFHNQRFLIMIGLILAYGLVYPLITYIKIQRHLNGSFAENREIFEKAFKELDYIKVEEASDKLVFRKKTHFSRFRQWYEDRIVIYTAENPVIMSGMRKSLIRIDRLIDQYLLKAVE